MTFQMHLDKAPGPDGMNPTFFQIYWGIMGREVASCSQKWFEQGELPELVNNTIIVLISKKDNSKTIKDLRPISLCNVFYKIFSKTLTNQMRMIL